MKRFKYKNARTVNEAVSLLKLGNASLLAGGTDILNLLKAGAMTQPPETLVNIKNIPGLDYITENSRGLKIGALTRIADIASSPLIKEKYPALAQATESVSSPPLREMGTIGGNLCQGVQCWYYRRSYITGNWFECLKKGGKVCYAIMGDNRYHSIFGGIKVDGMACVNHCPAHTDIPAYLDKVRDGDLAGAAEILLEFNPFPAITGRVCPHFCESECNRAIYDEPVSVKCVERYVGDYILQNVDEWIQSPENESKKRVAIIGSGPAGLSAAFYLRRLGHSVTIFEVMPVAGGMLALTIPNYRLPDEILKREIDLIKASGVEIKTDIPIGTKITIPNLLRQGYAAIFIATGAQMGRKLPIPGADLDGTLVGLDFLRDVKLGRPVKLGQRVLVLGGGSVASDCARTALRNGAKEVHMACLESRETMPADPSEIEEAEEEGVIIHPSLNFTRIIGDGRVSGVECLSVSWMRFDADGRLELETVPNSEKVIPADTVIFAIGQATDLSVVKGTEGLKITERNTIVIDPETLETGVEGIFAGGDAVTVTGSVIKAFDWGKRAALSIDRYLGGTGIKPGEDGEDTKSLRRFNSSYLKKVSRVTTPKVAVSDRMKSMDIECVRGLSLNDIETEANRCFNCGCISINSSDIAPVLIALNAKIKTSERVIPAEEFFTVRRDKSVLLDDGEIVTEIQVPKPKSGTKQTFTKFALRPTIDFAIVSVATAITTRDGKVADARIVLGAVAPVPYRATGAEDALKGKTITEAVAETAGVAAVENSLPLPNNKYKAQIAKTLIKRAILA